MPSTIGVIHSFRMMVPKEKSPNFQRDQREKSPLPIKPIEYQGTNQLCDVFFSEKLCRYGGV